MRTVDLDQHDVNTRFRRQRRDHAERRDLGDLAVEGQLRIGVEADLDRLIELKLVDVGLIHPRADTHRLRVDDVDDRHAGANLFAFLDLRHRVGLPDRPEHRHPADRRDDGHPLRVGFGLTHRALRAVAADLQYLEVGLGGLALEGVGFFQLIERGRCLLDGEVVLLGLDFRQELVLDRLELRARQRAFGEQDLAVVTRSRGALASVLLLDLLVEIVQLRAAIECGRKLRLPIELDDEIAFFDWSPRLDELGDDEGLRSGTRKTWSRDGSGVHGLDRAAQSDRAHEVLASHRGSGRSSPLLSGSGIPGIASSQKRGAGGRADQHDRDGYPQARVALGRHRLLRLSDGRLDLLVGAFLG